MNEMPPEMASDDSDGYLSRNKPYLNRLQRERRARMVRIDYMPSDAAIEAIELRRGDSYPLNTHSGVIDAILIEWYETTGIKYRRLHGPPTSAGRGFVSPEHARANNFGRKEKPEWLVHWESRQRVVCGARRRRDGKPCQSLSVPGKKRCKWHGGCSTGPKTQKGKQKALANLRQFRQA
jgi:hypothetical protein